MGPRPCAMQTFCVCCPVESEQKCKDGPKPFPRRTNKAIVEISPYYLILQLHQTHFKQIVIAVGLLPTVRLSPTIKRCVLWGLQARLASMRSAVAWNGFRWRFRKVSKFLGKQIEGSTGCSIQVEPRKVAVQHRHPLLNKCWTTKLCLLRGFQPRCWFCCVEIGLSRRLKWWKAESVDVYG